jgi:hypothetical protein
MADRPKHPKKDVEAAVQYCEEHSWTFRKMGHWGRMYCPHPDHADRCHISIFGTPKNEGNHAQQIKRAVDRCPHRKKEEDDENV